MLIPVNPPFHPFHHSITVNFLLDGNQGNMTKGDGIRSGRRQILGYWLSKFKRNPY